MWQKIPQKNIKRIKRTHTANLTLFKWIYEYIVLMVKSFADVGINFSHMISSLLFILFWEQLILTPEKPYVMPFNFIITKMSLSLQEISRIRDKR